MTRVLAMLKRLDFRDALAFGGVSGVCGGAWMIYPPAALIVFGMLCLSLWWMGRR